MSLKSVLGRGDVFALAFGAIIGWGWVVLSGAMIDRAGTLGSVVALLAGALMVGFVGLTYAELTAALPRAGGELAYTYRALGPTWAWVCGWTLILAYAGVCAFEAVAIATVARYVFPGIEFGHLYSVAGSEVHASWILVGVGLSLFIGWVNWVGIKSSAFLQQVALIALTAVGVAFFAGSLSLGKAANLQPYFTTGSGLLHAMILTPFLMVGFDVIPQVAEEISIPMKTVGRLILFSIGLAAVWYVLVQLSVGLGLPAAAHAASELPTADAAAAVYGWKFAGHLLIFGGFLGILTSWNSFFVGATRLLFGMARAQMLPHAFARLHPKHGTPTFAIVFVTIFSMAAPFLGRRALVWVADAASLAITVAYLFVAISFVVLRRREPNLPRPYNIRHWRPVGSIAVVITIAFVLLYMPFSPSALIWPYEWGIVLGWVLLGMVAYLMGRRAHGTIDRGVQENIIFGQYARATAVGTASQED